MENNLYWASSLIGGGTGALDAIDGADAKGNGSNIPLADGDGAIVLTASGARVYILDDDSGASESSPDVISPDTNAGTKRWIRKPTPGLVKDISTTANLEAGYTYRVTSGSAFTGTLPASPSDGDEIGFIDESLAWATYNFTIGRNTKNIAGAAEDLVCDSPAIFKLKYKASTTNWGFFV